MSEFQFNSQSSHGIDGKEEVKYEIPQKKSIHFITEKEKKAFGKTILSAQGKHSKNFSDRKSVV